jgi:hypothetical protein
LRRERLQREGLHVERWQQAHLAQQHQLEGPQRGRLRGGLGAGMLARQHLDDARIGVEQRLVRVVARQQAQQQLVDVVARHQRLAGRHDVAAHPLGALERADLGVAAVVELQGCNGSSTGRKLELGRFAPLATSAMRPWWRVKTSRIRLDSLQS